MKIVALVGSLRQDSYNMKLTRFIKERYRRAFELEIADIRSLPHFDQDHENDPPAIVFDFKNRIAGADGVLIATPEFNWSVPGVLKNALDWASRVPRVFNGKPVLATGAWGTLRAQLHLREILSGPGLAAKMLPAGNNQVLISFAEHKFDEAGRLTDPDLLRFLDKVMERFTDLIQQGD